VLSKYFSAKMAQSPQNNGPILLWSTHVLSSSSLSSIIINGDGGYGLLAVYIGGLAAQAGWLGPKVGGHLAPLPYSSREPSELSQWLCSYDDSTIKIVVIIIINNLTCRTPTQAL